MKLINQTQDGLLDYTVAQLAHFFPDKRSDGRALIQAHMAESLSRLQRCINGVRFWKENEFHYLFSPHYCIYLYYLANTIWRNTADTEICTKLFLLNKALNGIDCFYDVELPEIFCISHTVGVVLSKATYRNYLALHQNVTVGKNHGIAPVLEEGVVLYPNCAVIGNCRIGARTVVSQGVGIIDQDTPGDTGVFRGNGRELLFKPLKRNLLEELFRL
jgi:serine O-acetyltransferase